MAQRWAYFWAMLFTPLVLGPSLAHLLALPNKIALSRDHYFAVQHIYRGWALLGFVVAAAILSTLVLAILLRNQRRPFLGALVAWLCLVSAHIIFWGYTYPANRATDNWTVAPGNWAELRSQWEYSHAAAAVLNLIAMVALILSVLAWRAEQNRTVLRA
jgi:hypothetical protein